MAKTSLSHLLARQKPLAALLSEAASLVPERWWLEDPAGQAVFGEPLGEATQQRPVQAAGEVIGWVKGAGAAGAFIAALLENWLRQESEKRLLGAETLHLYREINLLFSFAEKLSTAPGTAAIARLTLQEAAQIIQFEGGWVFFEHKKAGQAELLAAAGREARSGQEADFLQKMAHSGKSEIRSTPEGGGQLLCAALSIGQRVLGSVVLLGPPEREFAAADLKLLSTLAAQAAAALENAAQHELATAQALREQRDQLTFELALKNPFFKKMVSVAESRCADAAFSVAVLSETLHLSPSQLQRKVAAITDLTPTQVIRDLRLARAKHLLQTTDLTVAEVSFQSGFNDPSYFTRLFVREMGCAPSEWRGN